MATASQPPSIYPVLRFADADRALSFLSDAFGFKEVAVHRDDAGTIVHATMSWRGGVVMFSGSKGAGDTFDLGPVVVYVAVEDPDAHHDRAVSAGAEVVMELTDQDYGSREYAARDAEGNVWCFGTYQPTAG
jgi:uncharacterized glyoxalase superfamily protein PhnB